MLEIQFVSEDNPARFRMRGRIAHVSPQGVGVAFIEPLPEGAYRALQRRALAPASEERDDALRRRCGEALRRRCGEALRETLMSMLGEFFGAFEGVLLEEAEQCESDRERIAHLDALSWAKAHRADLETRLLTQALATEESLDCRPGFAESGTIDRQPLSLVKNDDFEDWLNLNLEIAKVEHNHEESLAMLERRFARLPRRKTDQRNNPYAPLHIGAALRCALSDSPLQMRHKKIAYREYAKSLDRRAAPLYERLIDIAEACGLSDEPPAPTEPERPLPVAPNATEKPARASLGLRREVAEPEEETPAPEAWTPMRPSATLHSHLARRTNGAARPASPPPPDEAPPGAASARFAQASNDDTSVEAGNVYATANVLLGLLTNAPGLSLEAANRVELHDDPDISALHGLMQTLKTETPRADNGAGIAAMHTLGAHLGTILSENVLAPGVKPFLRRLQAPLLKAAATHPDWLRSRSHPAFEILDQLDRLALATNPEGEIDNGALRQLLNRTIERAIGEAETRPEALLELQEQLGQVVAPLLRARERRIERVREVCEGHQRVEQAHRRADAEIRARVEGIAAPAAVLNLLDAGWRQLLALTALREGTDSALWRERLAVLDRLLAWLKPGNAPNEPSLREAHRLIDYIDENLRDLGIEHGKLHPLLREFEALLPTDAAVPKRQPKFVFTPAIAPPQDEALDARRRETLEPLRVGQWFKFAQPQNRKTPLCLAWIGADPPLYVFVNRKGVRDAALAPSALADGLLEGRIEPTENQELPLMERTAQSLVETMRQRLRHQAAHDDVTGLINRREFLWRLRKLASAYERPERAGALGLLELIHLRKTARLYGAEAGDRLLREGADIVGALLEPSDILARVGDDSFGLYFDAQFEEQAREKAETILKTLSERRFKYGQRSYSLDANLGLAMLSSARGDIELLLKRADAACLAAKLRRPNLLQVYAEDDAELRKQRSLMNWAGRLDRLLAENELFARCQKIAPLFPERETHSHFEILLGVYDEEGRAVSPFELILAAEQWKRISEIDRWQICATFDWIRRHPETFAKIGGFSINLSGQSVISEEFLDFLHEKLEAAEFPRDKIVFEITETSAVENYLPIDRFMRKIGRYGCKFSLDDFGSGYSSYAYLKNMRVDYLKIDGAFIKELATSPKDYAMVKSMHEVARSLGLKTIAEFVDSPQTVDKLREIGVDFAQGYLVHKPIPLEELLVAEAPAEKPPRPVDPG
jgi:diguanylate cyclase (GGDEF)-like protein